MKRLGAMVVFTSGIVGAGRVVCLSFGVGGWCGVSVPVASRWWGMGSSTLLGPEESAGPVLFVGWGGVGCSGPPFARGHLLMLEGVGGVVV